MTAILEPAVDLLDFELPNALRAHEPPEARGLRRDHVRLLVSHRSDDAVTHTRACALPEHLRTGDLLVVNVSGTLAASVDGLLAGDTRVELHVSSTLPGGLHLLELRRPAVGATAASRPWPDGGAEGDTVVLPAGASARLLARFPAGTPGRLWLAELDVPAPLASYLAAHGRPIRYDYVSRDWPLAAYQTVFATEPGSAEMPSAARPFTAELVTALMAAGVDIAPLLLHTGVSSLEDHEPPYPERFRVPADTARRVNAARSAGGRVIAVGTTVVRALETVADERGTAHPGEGWTELVITPARGVRVVDGIVTGWHEPRASHLAMLEAIAGRRHLEVAYRAALDSGYRWHEFGDLHLVLP